MKLLQKSNSEISASDEEMLDALAVMIFSIIKDQIEAVPNEKDVIFDL